MIKHDKRKHGEHIFIYKKYTYKHDLKTHDTSWYKHHSNIRVTWYKQKSEKYDAKNKPWYKHDKKTRYKQDANMIQAWYKHDTSVIQARYKHDTSMIQAW